MRKRFLSIFICICMIFAIQMPVGFAAVSPAEEDILFEDDFEDYAEGTTAIDVAVKGWSGVPAVANHTLAEEDDGNHYMKINATVADTDAGISKQQYPVAYQSVAVDVGDTLAVSASVMVTDSSVNKAIFYLQLREGTGKNLRVTLNNFSTSSVLFNEVGTGYKAVGGKWCHYEVYIKIAAAGSLSDVVMKFYGEGVVDAEGNAVTEDNPVILMEQVSLDTLSIDTNKSVRVLFNNNIGLSSITNGSEENQAYVGLDNVVIFNADGATEGYDLSDLKVNGETVLGFDKDTAEYNVSVAYDAASAVIEATATSADSTVVIDNNNITQFPATAKVTVTNVIGLSNTYTINLTKAANVSVKTSSVSVKAANGTVNANIDGTAESWNAAHSASYEVGASITLTAVADSGAEFMYWVDESSERIVSKEETYSFIVGTDISLKAVFASANSYFIMFTSANGKVVAASDSGEVSVPAAPYIGGYTFAGWYLDGVLQTLEVGQTVTAADKNLHYKAGFTRETTDYQVTLVNADKESASYKYNDKVEVTAVDRSSEGLVFAYWMKDNKVVSYSETYSFYVSGSTVVEAVYAESAAEKKEVISISARQVDTSRMGFFTEYDISAQYTVVETGILLGESAGLNLESAPIKAVAVGKNNKGQFTVRKASLTAGDTYYGRGYLIYTDGEVVYTIYSDEISATME